jgi:dimethyladenosine transferase 1
MLKFTIKGTAFVPKPEVDVGVVTIHPLKRPLTDLNFDLVEKVVRHIFSMRQKYCRRGVGTLYPEDVRDELVQQTFKIADVDQYARPFQLTTEECLRIASAYNDIIRKYPGMETYNYRAPKKKQLEDNAAYKIDEYF